jgi:hypothetical protein
LAGQVTQAVLVPEMKYWLAVQQWVVAPSGEQNLVVPTPHVPVQAMTWASKSVSLSMVSHTSDVPVVLVTMSLKYEKASAIGTGKVLCKLAVQAGRSDTACRLTHTKPSMEPASTKDLGPLVGLRKDVVILKDPSVRCIVDWS